MPSSGNRSTRENDGDDLPARRLRLALELSEAGFTMMRQNLCRRFPDASPEEIEEQLRQWLATADGLPRSHFRPRPDGFR